MQGLLTSQNRWSCMAEPAASAGTAQELLLALTSKLKCLTTCHESRQHAGCASYARPAWTSHQPLTITLLMLTSQANIPGLNGTSTCVQTRSHASELFKVSSPPPAAFWHPAAHTLPSHTDLLPSSHPAAAAIPEASSQQLEVQQIPRPWQ